jgi:chromosome segregation ATPase
MMSVAMFPAIRKLYTLLVGWLAGLIALFSEKSPELYGEIEKLKELVTTRLQDISRSPALLNATDKCLRWYSARSSYIAISWANFLEQNPAVKAKIVLATNFLLKIFQFANKFVQDAAQKLLQHPSLQSFMNHPRFKSLANHPVMQWLLQQPKTEEDNLVKTSYHQTAAVATNFLGGFSVSAQKATSDPTKVTMKFRTDPANIHKLVNHMKAIDEDAMAADNFVWMCLCVFTVVVVTSLSWLAVMLASRGPKYRRTVHLIAVLVTSILLYFIFYFSVKLQSLDEDVHKVFKFLLAGSYIPFLILIVIVYIRTWGRQVKEKSVVNQGEFIENDKAVVGLRQQVKEMEMARTKDILEASAALENRRLSLEQSEKDGADLKARLSALSDDLLSAQKSKEEAMKTLEEEQKRIADLPTKTVILSMDSEAEGSMSMPTTDRKVSQGKPNGISDADKKVAAAQAESAKEIAELTNKLAVVQNELMENRAAHAALSDLRAAEESIRSELVKKGQTMQSQNDKVISGLQKQVLVIQTELAASIKGCDTAAKQLEAEQKKLTALSGEKAGLQTALDGLTASLSTVTAALEVAKQEKVQAAAAMNGERSKDTLRVEAEKKAAAQKVADLTARQGELEKEKTAIIEEVELLKSQVASAEAEKSNVAKDMEVKKKQHDEEVASIQKKIKELEAGHKSSLLAIQTELAASIKGCDTAAKQLEAEQKKLTALSEEKAGLQTALDGLTVQLDTAKKESLALTASLSTVTAALDSEKLKATTAQAAADQKVKDLTARIGQLEKEKTDIETQQMSSLSTARETHAASVEEKNMISQDKATLEIRLKEATAAASIAESKHAAAMTDVLAKLASTQDSWRLATQEGIAAKELANTAADDLQKLVAEKNAELGGVQARLREVEAARTAGLRENEEVKARLAAQLAKSAADSATNEEELREVESQLASFVEVCNSTRASLLAAQEDLRVSETRRQEDIASFQVKLKEAEDSKVTLADRLESDRVKLVALEVQAITAASTGETGLDRLQGLLDASEVEKKRILAQVDDLRESINVSRAEIADMQSKRDMDVNFLQGKLEEVQREKQVATAEIDAISVRLQSSLDVINFFEKEREEDIKSVQKELKASAQARKQIIADFVTAKDDMEAEEEELRKSRPVSPARGALGSLFLHSPARTPEAKKSPVSDSIELAMMRQTIDDLTMAKEVAVRDCEVIQKRLESALTELEEYEGTRDTEVMQMQQALAALELLEFERDELQAEVDSLREQLGMPPLTLSIVSNSTTSEGSEAPAAEKRPSLILSNPARPVSSTIGSRTNSQEHVGPNIIASETPSAAPADTTRSILASVSNPMLCSTNPLRMKGQDQPAESSSDHPPDGPLPLIMTSRFNWANSKTVAMMQGKRKSAPALIHFTSTDNGVQVEADGLIKVDNMQDAPDAIYWTASPSDSDSAASQCSTSAASHVVDSKASVGIISDSTISPMVQQTHSKGEEEEWRIGTGVQHTRNGDSATSVSPGRHRDGFASPYSAIVTPSDSPTQAEVAGHNAHLTAPVTVPQVTGLVNGNHFASVSGSECDEANNTWKGKDSQEAPTDDDVSLPVSTTITPESGSPLSASPSRSHSSSDIMPLPQCEGGQASLRRTSGDTKQRFVTSGGPLDPIPAPRSSLIPKKK